MVHPIDVRFRHCCSFVRYSRSSSPCCSFCSVTCLLFVSREFPLYLALIPKFLLPFWWTIQLAWYIRDHCFLQLFGGYICGATNIAVCLLFLFLFTIDFVITLEALEPLLGNIDRFDSDSSMQILIAIFIVMIKVIGLFYTVPSFVQNFSPIIT